MERSEAELIAAVLQGDSDEARKLARELPIGRIGAKGVNIAPFVRKDLFERLTAIAKQAGPALDSEGAPGGDKADVPEQPKSKSAGPRLPADWADLKVGDLVLSQDKDPKQGWWQTIVAEIAGDVIKLRWPDEPRGRPVLKPRLALGLMFAHEPCQQCLGVDIQCGCRLIDNPDRAVGHQKLGECHAALLAGGKITKGEM